MGLDLIVTYNLGFISLKRNLGTASSTGGEHEALLSNHKKRHVFYRVTVVSLNEQKQVTYKATSDVQSISMSRNSSHEILKIDTNKAKFPLLLSFNFVVNTPLSPGEEFKEDSEEESGPAVDEAANPTDDRQPQDVVDVPA